MINILSRLEADIQAEFSDMKTVATPYTVADLELIAQAKADAHAGKEPQTNKDVYIEAYSLEKSMQIIGGAA